MAKDNPTRATRLPDEMDADLQAYRDEKEMNNSEALRELIRSGLNEKRSDPLDDRPSGLLAGLLWDARRDFHTFVLVGLVAVLLSTLTSGIPSLLFGAVAVLYALTVAVGAADAALDNPLLRRLADVNGANSPGDEVEA